MARVTSAWRYAAYRDELLACGFSRAEALRLVVLAATGQAVLTDARFEVAAQPPAPVLFNAEPAATEQGHG